MKSSTELILMIAGILILTVMLFGYPTMLLWNYLMPELYSIYHTIGFWQACGIKFNSRILFKINNQHKKKD
jgi:hypothetical protein